MTKIAQATISKPIAQFDQMVEQRHVCRLSAFRLQPLSCLVVLFAAHPRQTYRVCRHRLGQTGAAATSFQFFQLLRVHQARSEISFICVRNSVGHIAHLGRHIARPCAAWPGNSRGSDNQQHDNAENQHFGPANVKHGATLLLVRRLLSTVSPSIVVPVSSVAGRLQRALAQALTETGNAARNIAHKRRNASTSEQQNQAKQRRQEFVPS